MKSYEQFETRIFSELVFELGKIEPTLGDKVSAIIRELDCIDSKEVACRLTTGEATLALLLTMNLVHSDVRGGEWGTA
jgi:hypothetical protein